MPELSTENILKMMDHNLDVTAHLLTIKRLLIAAGITTEADYDAMFESIRKSMPSPH